MRAISIQNVHHTCYAMISFLFWLLQGRRKKKFHQTNNDITPKKSTNKKLNLISLYAISIASTLHSPTVPIFHLFYITKKTSRTQMPFYHVEAAFPCFRRATHSPCQPIPVPLHFHTKTQTLTSNSFFFIFTIYSLSIILFYFMLFNMFRYETVLDLPVRW